MCTAEVLEILAFQYISMHHRRQKEYTSAKLSEMWAIRHDTRKNQDSMPIL